MDANLNFQTDGGNKVVLPGTRGSISDDITLENCNGNVVIGDLKKDSTVLKNLGITKGDELLGATLYFDNLNKNEVMDIIKAAEPYKTGLQLHVKNEAKSPERGFAAPSFNLRNESESPDMVFTAPSFNVKNEAKSTDNVFTAPSFNIRTDDLDFRDSAYENLFNNKIKRHLKPAKSMENLSEPSSKRAYMKSDVARLAVRQSADLESPSLDIHGGDIKTLNTGVSVPGKQLEYNSPSLSMDLGANAGVRPKTDLSGNIKSPEIDISVPKMKGTFKGPEVNMEPAFAAPSIKIPAVNIPEGKISVHENDLHLRAPAVNGNIHIKDPKFKGNIEAPTLDIEGPNASLKSSDTKVSSPHFKMPSFGLSGPSVKVPEFGLSGPSVKVPSFGLSGPSVKVPEFDGSMGSPSLDVSLPKVEGDLRAPVAKVDIPHVDVKRPKFKMPSLGMGNAEAGLPDADLNVHSRSMKGDFDISVPKLQTNIEGPSIEVNTPAINLHGPEKNIKGPHFKMPSFGFSGPTVTSPELNNDIKTRSLDVSLPKLDVDFKTPNAKVDLPSVDVKGPKVKMPSFGNTKLSGPDVGLNLKHPEINGDIDITSPKLKANFEAPDLDINEPNISFKGPEKKIKGPQFKMPSFGMSGPGLKTPDINVDGSIKGPEVDVSVPKVKGNFKGPEFGVDLPDVNISVPKIKMPSVEIPSVDVSLPEGGLNVKAPNIKGDINIKGPKLKGDIEVPNLDVKAPNINVTGSDKKVVSPHFKMPSFGFSGPNVKTPKLDGNLETPSLDVSLPKVEGELNAPTAKVDLPSVEGKGPTFKMPSMGIFNTKASIPDVDLNVKSPGFKSDIDLPSPKLKANIEVPDIDINASNISVKVPDKKIKGPQFKMPSFGMSGPGLKTPDIKVDGSIKGPEVDVSTPKVKGKLKAPEVGVELPDAEIKIPKITMPSVDIPSVDISLPEGGLNVKAPELKGDIKAPKIDVEAPKANLKKPHFKMPSFKNFGTSVKSPELDASMPKLEGDIKGPSAKLDVPNVETKGPKFKMPSLKMVHTKAGIPDADLSLKAQGLKGDIYVPTAKLQGDLKSATLDSKTPDVSLKMPEKSMTVPANVKGPNINLDLPTADVKGPKFKMPSFGMSGLNAKAPKVDGKITTPSLDVSLPKVDANLKSPSVNVDLPNVEAKSPKFKMPSMGISNVKGDIPEADLNVKSPDINVDINVPNLKLKGSEKFKGPQFKMPSFGISGPSLKTPDINIDSNSKGPEVDVSAPKVKGKLKDPDFDVVLPDVDIRAPKMKMPSIDIPSVDLSLPQAGLSVKAPELKGDINIKDPKLKGGIQVPSLDIEGPDINVKGADKKGFSPHFKMPSFGKSGPSIENPKLRGNLETPSLDVSLPKFEGDFKSPSAKVDLPGVDAKDQTFKIPSFGIVNSKTSVPDVDFNVKCPELKGGFDVPSPKLKTSFEGPELDINAPNINLKGPEKKIKGPQFKMPSFEMSGPNLKSPDINIDGNMKIPEVEVSVPKVKGNVKAPEIDVDLSNAEFKAPKITMPSVDIPSVDLSLPEGRLSVKSPELKGDININNPKVKGDMKVPNMDIKAPNINVKGSGKKGFSPHFKMPSFGISGPSVKTPKMDGNLEAPSLDVSLPKFEGDLKAPSVKVDLPSVDAKGPTFKLPSMGIFNEKASVPDVDLKVKSPEFKGDLDVPAPKLKANIEGPGLDINSPTINLKGPEKKIKGPQFKMPSFGMSGPSLKTPDIGVDGNIKGPELNVSVPKVKGKFKGPEVGVDLPDAEIKAPKIKMPSVDIPSVDISLPEGGLNVKAPELKGDINISNPKLKGDFKMPNLDINAPDIKVKSPEFKMPSLELLGPNVKSSKIDGNITAPSLDVSVPKVDTDLKAPTAKVNLPKLDAKGPKIKMPSLNLFQGKTEIPDVDLSLKSPKLKNNIDIPTPNVKGDFSGPSLDNSGPQIKGPSIQVSGPKIESPDLQLDTKMKGPGVALSAPKLKGPEINMDVPKVDPKSSKFKLPSFKLFQKKGTHDIDMNLKSPELSGNVSVPKLQSKIDTSEIKVNAPNINVKKTEKMINTPQFKMHSFGISGPNINAPSIETEGKVNERGIDVSMPETKGTFKAPDVNINFKPPSLNISQNTLKDDFTLKTPQLTGDAGIKVSTMEGNIKGPKLDMAVPNNEVKTPEAKINAPKFKVPSFGNLGYSKQTPDVEVTLPFVEGKLESPAVNTHLPNIDVKHPNIDMSLPEIRPGKGVPEINFNVNAPDIKVHSDIAIPKLKGNSEGPSLDIDALNVSLKRSQKNMNLPQYNTPSVQMSGPAIEMPKINIVRKYDTPNVDVALPSVKNTFKGPEINVDPANVDIALPKFKQPSASSSSEKPLNLDVSFPSDTITPKKKILVPDIDINLESPVDLSAPELKGQIKSPHLDINAQNENPKSADKKGSGPQFKFPSFGFTAPNVEAPDVKLDSNIKSDIKTTMPKVEIKGKSPSVNVDLANIGVHDKTIKVPSIPGVQIKSNLPNAQLNLESSNLEKNIKIPDVNLSTQLKTPEIGVSVTEDNRKLHNAAANLDSPKGNRHQNSPNKKGKESSLKFPFDFSGIPDIDFAFSPPKQSSS